MLSSAIKLTKCKLHLHRGKLEVLLYCFVMWFVVKGINMVVVHINDFVYKGFIILCLSLGGCFTDKDAPGSTSSLATTRSIATTANATGCAWYLILSSSHIKFP